MKFTREKKDDLLHPGSAKVNFTDEVSQFRVIATREGVFFAQPTDGPRDFFIDSQATLQVFAKTLSDAWRDHLLLKPRLTLNDSGH